MFKFEESVPKVGSVIRFLVLQISAFPKREGQWGAEYKEEGYRLVECLVISRFVDEGVTHLRLSEETHQLLTIKGNEAKTQSNSISCIVRILQ